MSFAIDLPESTKSKIASWNLPGHLLDEILEHLYEELAVSPSAHLERVPKPADILQYSFCASDREVPPRNYLFVFDVAYATDEETLVIRGCDFVAIPS